MRCLKHAVRVGAAVATLLVMQSQSHAQVAAATPGDKAETITLDQAIARATENEPAFATARAEQRVAALERGIARTALLPTATYHNQAIYTEPNGVPASRIGQTTNAPSPVFIANNAVREYASQGVFDEKLGLGQIGAIRSANADAARAQAELEIARRGLVNTVASLFYEVRARAERGQITHRALDEANQFLEITQKREGAREAAHTDVLKAQLQQQQRQREMLDEQVAADKARIELAVLLFPDPTTPFQVAAEDAPSMLPDKATIQGLAGQSNPELLSAVAGLQASQADTYTARTSLLPELGLNFTYGIDATNFASNGPDGIHNLGYSMSAQLDIPVWDWLATERKIKQAKLREGAAKVVLTAMQRRLMADLAEFYAEASTANQQLASLTACVVTARESLRLTNLRYIDGESTALEVVDAEGALISAENAKLDGRTRYELALLNLQTLTGRL